MMTTTTKSSSARRRRRRRRQSTPTGRFSCKCVGMVLLLVLVVIIFQLHGDFNKYAQQEQLSQQSNNDAVISPRNNKNDDKYIPKLVICGTVYNVQQHLPAIQKSIARLVANHTFELVHLLFANHNSTDDSVRHLEQWGSQLSKNVTVFSLASRTSQSSSSNYKDGDDEPFKERTVRLAQARNFLWQQVSLLSRGSATVSSSSSSSTTNSSNNTFDNGNTGSQIDYVLMMDMDDVNWHLSNVHECLNLPTNWTVCCCNSYKVYYDLWALRTLDDGDSDVRIKGNNHQPNKNWLPVPAGHQPSGFGRHRHSKPFRHIPAGHEPIQVKSCFGGAALYKYTNQDFVMVANSNPYVGMMTMMMEDDHTSRNGDKNSSSNHKRGKKHAVCEHVSFHLKLYARNHSLYIQPSFLNDGPSDERMLYFGAVKKRLEPEFKRSWEETPHYYQQFWD